MNAKRRYDYKIWLNHLKGWNRSILFLDFAKVFLITLNGIFGLLGLAMLGIGGYVMVEVKKYSVSFLLRPFLYDRWWKCTILVDILHFKIIILGCYRIIVRRHPNFYSLSWFICVPPFIPWFVWCLQREQMHERNICSCFIHPCSLSDLCWYCRIRQGSFSQFYHMLNQEFFSKQWF